MLRNAARISLLFSLGFGLITLTDLVPSAFAAGQKNPPTQFTISKVTANGLDTLNPLLSIEGANFGPSPGLFMGAPGGMLVQLTVLSSSGDFISAQSTGATSA